MSYSKSNIIDRLYNTAKDVYYNSYSPYSKFSVSATVLCGDNIFSGVNIENSSYGLTVCAERVAIFKAVSEGCRDIDAILILTKDASYPCGACRQVMSEFNSEMLVYLADLDGHIVESNLKKLLPHQFDSCSFADSNNT
jgi:cytidine deaminase